MKYLKTFSLSLILLCWAGHFVAAQNWPTLDAVVYNNISDKYYFFFGKYCVVKERGKYIDGLPLLITEEWEGFPKSWHGGNIDAVCFVSDNVAQVGLPGTQQKGTYWFFKGDEVCKKVMGERMSTPIKMNSKDGFPGIPWSSIDAVTFNTSSQTYYFFKGNEYVSKKKGEPVNTKKVRTDSDDGFVNLAGDRPIKAVDFSQDNREYYFFWDEFYMTKVMGKDIAAGTQPRRYDKDGEKGFKWKERSANNFVGLANEAGYVANFYVSWESGGKKDSWSKKGVALTYEKLVKLPMDARNINISCYVFDALKDDKDGPKVFSESMNIPPNKWYKVYGTVFEPKWKQEKNSTNLLGSVATFFTNDIGNALEDALDDLNDAMNDAQYAVVKELAKRDFEAKKDFILGFGDAAAKVVADQAFIQSLYRTAKAKDPNVANDIMKQLVGRNEFKDTFQKATGFQSLSVGFTAGASSVIGTEGSFGYGISLDAKKTKGYAGLDGSLGVQGGLGLGCQFGIWTDPPQNLDGASVAVNVEVGSGVGVSFALVYNVSVDANNVPKFTFAGVAVTPGIGAGMGASVGSGYSWVY
jgi:hypothetical protein